MGTQSHPDPRWEEPDLESRRSRSGNALLRAGPSSREPVAWAAWTLQPPCETPLGRKAASRSHPVGPGFRVSVALVVVLGFHSTNKILRVVHPSCSESFARQHDIRKWQCFSDLLGQLPHGMSTPFFFACGDSGLRSGLRTARAALWASWADCLPMIEERHDDVARTMVAALNDLPEFAAHLLGVVECLLVLQAKGTNGLHPSPTRSARAWHRPPRLADLRSTCSCGAFPLQCHLGAPVSNGASHSRDLCLVRGFTFLAHVSHPRAAPPSLLASPASFLSHLPCGGPLDIFDHHRAACPRSGVLESRGWVLAAARDSTNVFVRDLDLPVVRHDARRMEVVADGLPLFGGAQLEGISKDTHSLLEETSMQNWER